MVRSGVRGEGTRRQTDRDPGELGWDESLYEDGGSGGPGDLNDSGGPGTGEIMSFEAASSGGGSGGPDSRDAGHGGKGRGKRKRRILRWSATVLAVLIVGSGGAGYLYYQHLNHNLNKDDLYLGDQKDRAAKPKANAAGQTPLNILLLGSDARDSKANQKLGGAKDTFGAAPRADVQMLLHLSADRSNMSVVSLPRDTLVDLPKCTAPDGTVYEATTERHLVNESLERGGPGCTVATWESLTNIRIDHFMMIDFAGVVSMADAIGGVPVCVKANIYSKDSSGHGSGLKLEKGTTKIKGEQALQWLRTRYGFEDGSDLARAEAQHMYMNSMVRELRENATLTNPDKLMGLAETATDALTVDDGLGSVKKLYDLATELRKVPTGRITMTTMPNRYVGARVEPTEDAQTLFRMVRDDIALDGKDDKDGKKKPPKQTASKDPSAPDNEIGVIVQNGTGSTTEAAVPGRAAAVAGLLEEQGFTSADADTSTAAVSEDRTEIHYPSAELEGDAQRVAKSLGIPMSSVTKSTDVTGVTLVVGADWREGTTYEPPKAEDKTPESADVMNGADDTQCMPVNPAYSW